MTGAGAAQPAMEPEERREVDGGETAEPDEERRFDFAVVHDRELAVAVARLLMGRID